MTVSRRSQTWIWVVIGTFTLALVITAVVGVSQATRLLADDGSSASPRLEDQLELPTSFSSDRSDTFPDLTVELFPDGTARVVGAPLGTLDFVDGKTCLRPSADLTSAAGTWSYYKPGWVVISANGLSLPLGASSEFMGSLNWSQVGFDDCDSREATWLSLGIS